MSQKKENLSNGIFVEYNVPIESSAQLDGDFMIEGIAINETTTSNGHKFIGEELKLAAPTLKGVPLLKDHNNSVDSIVGKVKIASFDESRRNIPFKAMVKDQKAIQLIRDGLLSTVSVGAQVDPNNIEELDNGNIVPHNITFKELSLVAVPADSGATFDVALNNAYQSFKSNSNENLKSTERGEMTMTEENTTPEDVKSEETEVKEEVKDEVSEKILKLLSNMDKRLEKLEQSDADEKPEAEEPKEEEKSEPEEEEEESEGEVEEKGDYKLTQGHNSFGIERKSYNY